MFLALIPAIIIMTALLLWLWMYRNQGIFGLAKLVLVLIGATSGLMWLINRFAVGIDSPHINQFLSLLPWGTVWIIDTVVLSVFFAATVRKQDSETTLQS